MLINNTKNHRKGGVGVGVCGGDSGTSTYLDSHVGGISVSVIVLA